MPCNRKNSEPICDSVKPKSTAQIEPTSIKEVATETSIDKEAIRIWTSVENHPLDFSSKKFKLTFKPFNLCGNENEAKSIDNNGNKNGDVPPCQASSTKIVPENGASSVPKETNDKCQNSDAGKNDEKLVGNFGKKMILKPAKFLLNGSVCYLIPANVLMSQSEINKLSAATNGSSDVAQKKLLEIPVKDNSTNDSMIRFPKIKVHQLKPNAFQMLSSLSTNYPVSSTRQSFENFNTRQWPDDFLQNVEKNVPGWRNLDNYPSIRQCKSARNGTPRIKVSQLKKPFSVTKNVDQMNQNRGGTYANQTPNKHKVLKYIIVSPKSGTLIFINNNKKIAGIKFNLNLFLVYFSKRELYLLIV